ncbi:hypothetical protein [Massilia sp. CT11-137]|uniref:hypothetical protein n=1 Tax=Massilia sp. CT11-137 TaxID=3393901 RepID=UPI0039B030F7
MTIDTDKLKALALVATAGPWRECGHDRGGCSCGQIWSTVADMPVAQSERGDEEIGKISDHVVKANARYIAAACPATVLELIAEVERLRADAARYRWLRDDCPDFEGMTSAWLYDDFDKVIDAAIAAKEPPCGP